MGSHLLRLCITAMLVQFKLVWTLSGIQPVNASKAIICLWTTSFTFTKTYQETLLVLVMVIGKKNWLLITSHKLYQKILPEWFWTVTLWFLAVSMRHSKVCLNSQTLLMFTLHSYSTYYLIHRKSIPLLKRCKQPKIIMIGLLFTNNLQDF